MSRKQAGMSPAELSAFCGQVALILEAGLPLYDGMETLAASADGQNEDMLQSLSRRVTETGSLSEALRADDRWPDYLREMADIGERSGHLDQVMRGLERYYAREDRIRDAVVSAVSYPMVLGAMLVLIVGVLLWKVMPVFQRVLNSMGVGLSGSGSSLMRIGTVLGWVVAVLVLILLVLVLAALILMKTSRREQVLSFLKRNFPALRRLNGKISASRVADVLSMLLASGFPTEEALEMSASVLEDPEAAEKLRSVKSSLDEGQSFADAVAGSGIFEKLHNSMIRMGAATGHEEQVFRTLAELYEEETEGEISRLLSIIEPSLVALLAVVIGAVLLAVLLPMAGILSSL